MYNYSCYSYIHSTRVQHQTEHKSIFYFNFHMILVAEETTGESIGDNAVFIELCDEVDCSEARGCERLNETSSISTFNLSPPSSHQSDLRELTESILVRATKRKQAEFEICLLGIFDFPIRQFQALLIRKFAQQSDRNLESQIVSFHLQIFVNNPDNQFHFLFFVHHFFS